MILKIHQATRHYGEGPEKVEALQGVDLDLAAGDFVAMMGPSGCGKSTLLHLGGAMDLPSSGSVTLLGRLTSSLPEHELTLLRREHIGFVFQSFHLVPSLSVEENIALPLFLAGCGEAEGLKKARALAEETGLGHRITHTPQKLSGGERQRVAIARAIIHRPALVVADEPTGSLDSLNGERIMNLLADLHKTHGMAILLATHDAGVAARAKRILHMKDGRWATENPSQPGIPAA